MAAIVSGGHGPNGNIPLPTQFQLPRSRVGRDQRKYLGRHDFNGRLDLLGGQLKPYRRHTGRIPLRQNLEKRLCASLLLITVLHAQRFDADRRIRSMVIRQIRSIQGYTGQMTSKSAS